MKTTLAPGLLALAMAVPTSGSAQAFSGAIFGF